jgi:hypothetical protein
MQGNTDEIRREQLEHELKEHEDKLIRDFSDIKSVLDDSLRLIEKAKRAIGEKRLVDADIAVIALKTRMEQARQSKELLEDKQSTRFSLFWRIFLYDFFGIIYLTQWRRYAIIST